MGEEIILLDILPSSFGMRVRIALAEKGIEYEYKQENMLDKSPLLLHMNPVHQLVPVLIHNGKPICESLIILEYIDEVWNDRSPLLPCDPYQRSQARFWANFVDTKIYDCAKKIIMNKGGEVQETSKKEMIEGLKVLEWELGDKLFFGGQTLGFMDIAFVPFYCWFYSYETCGNFNIRNECPKLMTWVHRCMEVESVSKSLIDPLKVYDYALQLRKRFGVDSN